MAGLDVGSRAEVSQTLGDLNAAGDIRIALVLRGKGQADIPDWITNVCDVQGGDVWVGDRADWDRRIAQATPSSRALEPASKDNNAVDGNPVVALNKVSVTYGEGTRPVCQNPISQMADVRFYAMSRGVYGPVKSGICKEPMVESLHVA